MNFSRQQAAVYIAVVGVAYAVACYLCAQTNVPRACLLGGIGIAFVLGIGHLADKWGE